MGMAERVPSVNVFRTSHIEPAVGLNRHSSHTSSAQGTRSTQGLGTRRAAVELTRARGFVCVHGFARRELVVLSVQ